MKKFRYEAMTLQGNAFRDTQEAESLPALYRSLKERNLFCMEAHELQSIGDLFSYRVNRRIRLKVLSIFTRQFSTMLGAGLPVIKCLDILYEQTTDKKLKNVLLGVYESVQHGESLSRAMKAQKGAFPPLLLNMVASGEAGGTLEKVILRMADQYEKESILQNRITQALIYPIVLTVVSVLILVVLLTFVMPTFINLFQQTGATLPVTTKLLLAVSNAITNGWYIILFVLAALVVIIRALLKKPDFLLSWDSAKLRFPVVGKLLITVECSRFARTLSSLFSSGMPIIQSLEIVADILTNHLLKKHVRTVEEEVRRGVPLSASVKRRKIFPPMFCAMLNVGEESGNMDEILQKTAAFYDEEAQAAITKLVSFIEPVMIVVLGVAVAFIVISIITPIYSLYSHLSNTGAAGL